MDFVKKVLVMKQISDGYSLVGKPISGIARLEAEDGVTTLYLSLINVASVSCGNYFAFIQDGNGKLYSFDLGKRPITFSAVLPNMPFIENGFCIGLSYISDDIPILVAYACSNALKICVSDFKRIITDKCIADRKTLKKAEDTTSYQEYNDEVVATENYYLNDSQIEDKLKIIDLLEKNYVRDETDVSSSKGKEEKRKEEDTIFEFEDKTDDCFCEKFSEENPYYSTVIKELEDIFYKFPEEEVLTRSLPCSKWAKVAYSEDKYYVVGLVKENNKEKYICYGVPAKYSPTPPKELAGYCSFIPLSVFDMKGDGYWMMFQDAITGESIKLNDY